MHRRAVIELSIGYCGVYQGGGPLGVKGEYMVQCMSIAVYKTASRIFCFKARDVCLINALCF